MNDTRKSQIAFHHDRKRGSLMAGLTLGLLALTFSLSLVLTPIAGAAAPTFLVQMPEGKTEAGSGAGELSNPRAVAANPITGHVYVGDRFNARIGEYTAWGAFVRAWGWDVSPEGTPGDTPSDQLEVCTTVCQAGNEGDGAGQFSAPNGGITVDAAGSVWVLESPGGEPNRRVQKFDSEGNFLLMLGGEVNKTTKANVCTKADLEGGDECGAGVPGTAPGQFSNDSIHSHITYNTKTNTIFVGDVDRIEEFNADGTFKSQIPFEGTLEAFDGESVEALTSDSSGNLYIALGSIEDIYKLSPTGEPLAPGKPGESGFEVGDPLGVAVDAVGNVYAIDLLGVSPEVNVVQFDAAAKRLLPTNAEEEEKEFFPYVPFQGPALTSLATNLCPGSEAPGNLYISFGYSGFGLPSYVRAYGTPPIGCEPPPTNPPEIKSQFATLVDTNGATLRTQINPRFWDDATYHVEYGTGKCSEGGCKELTPIAKLTSKVVNSVVTSPSVVIGDLTPGTTYHYRFVAESGGGGPVRGVEGKVGEDGAEGTFTTFALPTPLPPCPANAQVRTGASAKLPDCRAYEMVSPVDKNNGDAAPWIPKLGRPPRMFELNQSASSGERFAYSSKVPFPNSQASPFISEYLSMRTGGGWSSQPISPPRTALPLPADSLVSEFNGFSPDLCSAWLRNNSVAPLAVGAVAGFPNLYRRDNCSQPAAYEALTTVEPPQRDPARYHGLRVQGFSEDHSHVIFVANDKLTEDAPTLTGEAKEEELLLYAYTPEGLSFVCYLPNGNPSPKACAAGTAADPDGGDMSSVHNAISADGSRIFWTAYSGTAGFGENLGAPGQIYVRINGAETLKVSGTLSPEPAWYWTAADDGSKAIFSFADGPLKGNLYEFDVDKALAGEPGAAQLIAKRVGGPMGASEDASRIYFASEEDLDDGGPGSDGVNNLYLYEAGEDEGEGGFTFVMALTTADFAAGGGLAAIHEVPAQRAARVSPDGLHVVFGSSVTPTPTGYDNLDAASGKADREIYLYDAAQDELVCVSCNPTGARPVGEDLARGGAFATWAAARIQGWEALLHAPHVLSDDGGRVYFESHEALVPRDTNGVWDVYQWEGAGTGSCTENEATFSPASQGCVDLISSGESPEDSTFLDADPSGKNVFISTNSSLLVQDYGLSDVYDAREGGGLPPPPGIPPACEGEACQGAATPPDDPTPASSAFEGAGNITDDARPSCRKGKVRRKGRCVTRHSKKRANQNRRAAR